MFSESTVFTSTLILNVYKKIIKPSDHYEPLDKYIKAHLDGFGKNCSFLQGKCLIDFNKKKITYTIKLKQ